MNHSWPLVSLGDLIRLERRPVEVIPDLQYQEIGIYCFGKGIFHKTPRSGLEVGDKNLYKIRDGDLILQVTFAWEGAIALCSKAENGLYGSTRYPTFRVNEERCFAPFLVRYLVTRNGLEQINRICPGSAGRNRVLSLNRIHEVKVPLPPLAEQRRIVARIEELAAKINEARTLRQQAMHEADALFASVLLALLPRNIAMTRLGDLIAADGKISYGVLVPGPDVEDGVPFVRVQDLDARNPTEVPNKRISPEVEAQYERTRLRGGEILIGVVGSIGKVGIAPPSWAGANIARAVCRITPSGAIDRDYLALVLLAPPTQEYFRETTRTLAQPTLNVAQLAETPIPVASLSEQRRIVAEVGTVQAKVNALRKLQAETAAELDSLLPSILDKAFKREL